MKIPIIRTCMFLPFLLWLIPMTHAASPLRGLLERIDRGASEKLLVEQVRSSVDFFELDQKGDKPLVRGNSPVSIAMGINWYLKYHAGIHLSWNGMTTRLPDKLPPVKQKERHETTLALRYDLNYCTYSYSMAFWTWERWEREIDWMALHGINLPLTLVGSDVVWRRVLLRLGYSAEEADRFIAGPAFQAWWLMNNLEGWGGPNPESWYRHSEQLQKKILQRMREYGIKPVFPGYSGMIPHDAPQRLQLHTANPGKWCGYQRPAFLQPTDPRFPEIARIYYEEQARLFGKADYYSMDPCREGGNGEGGDLQRSGEAICRAMKQHSPKAVWVIQAWQANPRPALIDHLQQGDVLVLDLSSESCPQWGDSTTAGSRKGGFGKHTWLYCMLLNYGGNVGLHGKMDHLIESFYRARQSTYGHTMKGIGMTMEGIENNPVMYELLSELPWRAERFSREEWLKGYVTARYGCQNSQVMAAWELLAGSIYNCPPENRQQGTHESVFCARPRLDVRQASSWAASRDYYRPTDILRAANMMLAAADELRGNNNYEYDLTDILRQAVAEKGRMVSAVMTAAYKAGEAGLFHEASQRFLQLILLQDRLLATRPEFKVGRWIEQARNVGSSPAEKAHYEWNARIQITTWGHREAADRGGLHDYAHKEWSGLLRDLYYPRWKRWIEAMEHDMERNEEPDIDFYAMEEEWTRQTTHYAPHAEGDVTTTAREVYRQLTSP